MQEYCMIYAKIDDKLANGESQRGKGNSKSYTSTTSVIFEGLRNANAAQKHRKLHSIFVNSSNVTVRKRIGMDITFIIYSFLLDICRFLRYCNWYDTSF